MKSPDVWRKKRALRWVLILAAAALLAGVYAFHVGREMTDFGVCYQGGQRIIRGETLYREADGHLQFKYAPTSALFFAPLARLPYGAAKAVWYVLELVFLSGIFFLFFRVLPIAGKRPGPVVGWTFLIELKFLAREIELGQVNVFILFLLASMTYLLLHERERSAGFIWGGSLFFKPYALVFLPYFLLKRKLQTLIAGMVSVLVGLALPAILYGPRGYLAVLREWPATLSKSTTGLLASYDNASLYGFILKVFPSLSRPAAGGVLLTVFLALAVASLWMIKKGREEDPPPNPEFLEGAFLLVLVPLFSPLGWNYNYLYSIPAVMLVIAAWRRFSPAMRLILIFDFLMISTSLVEIWGRTAFQFYTRYAIVAVNFLIVLVALLRLRRKEAA